jgi:hypothetical protein
VSNHPEVSTPKSGLYDTIGSFPPLVLVLYELGHVENLVLTFEGGLLSKVMGIHFSRFWNSTEKAVTNSTLSSHSILICQYHDMRNVDGRSHVLYSKLLYIRASRVDRRA